MRTPKDRSGMTYGKLRIIKPTGTSDIRSKARWYYVECLGCGEVKPRNISNLVSGVNKAIYGCNECYHKSQYVYDATFDKLMCDLYTHMGNAVKIAEVFNIGKTTMYRILKKYNVPKYKKKQ